MLSKEDVTAFVTTFFANNLNNTPAWPAQKFFWGDNIPDKKLLNAIAAYAPVARPEEKILVLYDDTAWGSAKEGFVITDSCIYCKDSFLGQSKYIIKDLYSIELKTSVMSHVFGTCMIYINNEPTHVVTALNKDREIIKTFFVRLSKEMIHQFYNDKTKLQQVHDAKIKEINHFLLPEEEICYMALEVGTTNRYVVCTNKKLLFHFNSITRDIKYDQITTVQSEDYLSTGEETIYTPFKLSIHAAGSHTLIEFLEKEKVEEIIKIIMRYRKMGDVATSEATDLSSELLKLKSLLDSGILTSEEFSKFKGKLFKKY